LQILRGVKCPQVPPRHDDGGSELLKMAILHLQCFGINIDDWPEPNEDGTYPNGDDNADTEKPDEIDEMITDEDVDDTGEPDDDGFCEDVIGS
jgi:hypothetical protein